MSKKIFISIGIPAKNEQKSIYSTLESLVESISLLPFSYSAEIIVALNGSTDRTDEKVDAFIKQHKLNNIFISRTESQPGIIHAQRQVEKVRKYKGALMFFDADLLVDKYCIKELLQATDLNTVSAAFACPTPVNKGHASFWETIFNFSDYHPELFSKRQYIMGRGYSIKEFPDNQAFNSKNNKIPDYTWNLLELDKGPLVDDIFFTKYLIKKDLLKSIKYCPKAVVYFHPITNLMDFYNSQRRIVLERNRLEILYPEFKSISRSVYTRKHKRQFSSLKSKIQYDIYTLLYNTARKLAFLEYNVSYVLAKLGFNIKLTIWPVIKSSKRAFN